MEMKNGRFWYENIIEDNRPRIMYRFFVTGKDNFPFDMLRYDSCWPANSQDAWKLTDKNERSIELRSYKTPACARWSSFGWSVGTERIFE